MKTQPIKRCSKVIAVGLILSLLMSMAGCAKTDDSQYSLKKIRLTADEQSWSNPEEEYSDILALYSKKKCKGTLVVATDEDVLFLYAEVAVEKDGVRRYRRIRFSILPHAPRSSLPSAFCNCRKKAS